MYVFKTPVFRQETLLRFLIHLSLFKIPNQNHLLSDDFENL